MNVFPSSSKNHGKELGKVDLKTPYKASHNQAFGHEQIKALVKHLARRAAEEDFKMLLDAHALPDSKTDT